MTQISKNKYVRRAKISEYKFRKMIKYFAEDMSATQISLLTAINRNTVNRYLNEVRARIVEFCEQYAPFKDDAEIEIKAETANMEASLSSKITTNLGILKRRGKVYAETLANCTTNKVRQLLQKTNMVNTFTVHSVEIKEDAGIIAIGYDSESKYAGKPSYVESLDTFWQFTRERMSKFQGVAKHKFYLHLKESEFRFNFRNDNLYKVMLQLISNKPIS